MTQNSYLTKLFHEPTFSQVVPIQMSENGNVLVQSSGDNVTAGNPVGFVRENRSETTSIRW